MTSGGTNMEGVVNTPRLEIRLTEQEARICEILDAVAKRYEEKENKKVQLRIAGGWVRDKVNRLDALHRCSNNALWMFCRCCFSHASSLFFIVRPRLAIGALMS